MSEIISPEYNWKQAATQEGVDYGAVQKSFMDQSYGVVANKAKILFQDPFRLGFEIVHRNEKATKMVGIFAFRVNKNLLYAPTFFVNGEIKPADMLYRADVKRFVPLTEEWCAFLVRGVEEKSGDTVSKNRFRQADAYMDRLASPQRVKYASEGYYPAQYQDHASRTGVAYMEDVQRRANERFPEGSPVKWVGRNFADIEEMLQRDYAKNGKPTFAPPAAVSNGPAPGVATPGMKLQNGPAPGVATPGMKLQNGRAPGMPTPGLQATPGLQLRKSGTAAYMDRLASPQRVKYASEMDFAMIKAACDERLVDAFDADQDNFDMEKFASENPGVLADMSDAWPADMAEARDAFVKAARDGSLFKELVVHCADASPIKLLLPEVIDAHGPVALEKVAAMVEGNDFVGRFIAKTYTREQLENVGGWLAKEAAIEGPRPAITIITDPRLAKTAAHRETIFDKGYELIDDRPPETLNTVIEEIGDGTVKELSSPGKVSILLDDGSLKEVYLFRRDHNLLRDPSVPYSDHNAEYPKDKPEIIYCPKSKQLLELGYGRDVFGDEMIEQGKPAGCCTADKLQDGKCYVACSMETHRVSPIICINGKVKDGECTNITYCNEWGDESKLFYAPGRSEAQGRYISDETIFLEVDCDIDRKCRCGDKDDDGCGCTCGSPVGRIECKCDFVPISPSGISDWCRSAGGVTSSRDVTVKPSKNGLTFDIEHREDGTILKSARDLGWLEAHLALAEDFSMTTDMAGKILDKAVDKDVTYRVYDTQEKSAYLTRPEGMQDWIQSFDPELQVKMDAPQQQVLSTHTPQRPDQQQRYGDTHQRVPSTPKSGDEDLMPMDAVMSKSPEELAQMSEQYGMPHIFDHCAVGQMATTTHNVIDQIKKYVPDLETGVDRYFRILFLLRYRPADFEEHYGKDDLVEFEQDLTDLSGQSGEHLLKILQRFEPDQYSSQDN